MYSAFRRERVRGYYDCLNTLKDILRIVNFGEQKRMITSWLISYFMEMK